MKNILVFVGLLFLSSSIFSQTKWTTDKNHAQLHFSAFHFGIAHIEGIFKTFEVTMKSEKEDFTDAVVEMTAYVKSITTQVDMRDDDLRSNNWFDVDKFPTMVFKRTS